jgi:hypothetical protein
MCFYHIANDEFLKKFASNENLDVFFQISWAVGLLSQPQLSLNIALELDYIFDNLNKRESVHFLHQILISGIAGRECRQRHWSPLDLGSGRDCRDVMLNVECPNGLGEWVVVLYNAELGLSGLDNVLKIACFQILAEVFDAILVFWSIVFIMKLFMSSIDSIFFSQTGAWSL